MAGERIVFANFATQDLVALLAPEDRLEIVRMSVPGAVSPVGADKRSAIATVQRWDVVGSTPYASVTTGMARLRQLLAASPDPDEDFWLVIFGDGTFDEFVDDDERYREGVAVARIQSDLEALRRDFSGRRLGVVFLGIGEQAPLLARAWQGAGAITDTALTPPEIVDAMFGIAALITGRDPSQAAAQQLPVRPGPSAGSVEVESRFPLRRLTVFYQGDEPAELAVAPGSFLTTSAGERVELQNDGPYPTERGGLFGSVNLVGARDPDTVLDAGSYTLNLSSDVAVELESVRFLPEVALELEVLRSPAGSPLCSGDPVGITVRLREPLSGRPFDLSGLDALIVEGSLTGPGGATPLRFAPAAGDAFTASAPVPDGRSTLAVAARFPGYFNLRSPLLALEGEPCSGDARARFAPAELTAPTTFSAEPRPAGAAALIVDSGDPALLPPSAALVVERLPAGVALEVGGVRLDAVGDRVDGVPLAVGRPLEVGLLVDGRYRGDPAEVALRLDAAGPRFRWAPGGETALLRLRGGTETVALVPQGEPWSAPVDRLGASDPFTLEPRVNGEPVPGAALDGWRFSVEEGPPRLGLELRADPDSGLVELRPEAWCPLRFWCVLGLTPTGEVTARVSATAPGGGSAAADATLEIAAIGWWRAWGLPLLQLLLALLLVWYLIGQIVRPRFRRGSALVREERVRRTRRRTEVTGTTTRDIRSHRGLWTRLRPYAPERSVVWGYRLEATRGQSVALLGPFANDLRLNHELLDDGGRARQRVRVTPGSVLSREERRDRTETFTYRVGRR